MELTIEQKVEMLENMLGRERKLPEVDMTIVPKVDMTIVPMKWYAVLSSGTVVISKPFQLPTVGGTFNGWYDYSYEAFEPERNLVQAMELLNGLSSLSDLIWYIAFRGNKEYAIQCDTVEYTEYNHNLCKLIVNACLWWLENKVEE